MNQMLSGSLHEIRYEWPDSQKSSEGQNEGSKQIEMKVLEENQLKTNDVAYINGIHIQINK